MFLVQKHCPWEVDILSKGMLLVSTDVLPEVYLKVIEAKRMLSSGEVKTASEAIKICGISRSAYYKYKDSVFEYTHPLGKIVSLQATLRDRAGVLSNFLQKLYGVGANILTVNQGLPVSGTAHVSVSMRMPEENFDITELIYSLSALDGVVSVKRTLGE